MKFVQRALQSLPFIFAVFTATLGLTYYSYHLELQHQQELITDELQRKQDTINRAIDDRLHIYEQLLRSGAALFYGSDNVTRDEWQLFASTVQLSKHWPGIQGIGYAPFIEAGNINTHEQAINDQGFQEYNVHPKGARDYYAPIIYLEPFDWRNQRAFGYDMWSSPTRQAAMKLAMETGNSHATGVITLVQETQNDIQKGFLLYTPVYTQPPSPGRDNSDIQGWVYAPFRINDFMQQLLTEDTPALRIYDATNPKRLEKLYQRDHEQALSTLISNTQHLEVFGRQWRIDYFSPPQQWVASISEHGKLALASQLLVDLLLLLVLLLFRQNERSKERAIDSRHHELINELKVYTKEVNNQKKTISVLEGEVHTLQTWLQEREARIKELKNEHSKGSVKDE